MPTSPTATLIKLFQDGQTQMLDYLKRADERGERQNLATLKALVVIQEGQKTLQDGQKTLQDGQAVMVQSLERIEQTTRDIALLVDEALKASRESAERTAEILASIRPH